MRIGVYIHESYKPEFGGGFSYSNTLIKAIDGYSFDEPIEPVFITKNRELSAGSFKRELLYLPDFDTPTFTEKLRNKLCRVPILNRWLKPVKYDYSQLYRDFLTEKQIKVMYYTIADLMLFDDFPFIATFWDIAHCSTYPFPEFTYQSEYYRRENWYKTYLNKALLIFSESESGKKEIVKYLAINESKIVVVPLFAAELVDSNVQEEVSSSGLEKYGLVKNQYFLYPAQFWAHKNHYQLVHGFSSFIKGHTNKQFKLVLTGSDKGNAEYIKKAVRDTGLEKNVVFAGFVDDQTLNSLYKNAAALVMPSFLGPTNMPLIEAVKLQCPVICSDLKGHREILSDSALYIDPLSAESIAVAMNEIVLSDVQKNLKEKMKKLEVDFPFTITNTLKAINGGFKLAQNIRNCWG